MRILQVSPRFFPYIGGVENYVYHLSKELLNLECAVTVICANEPLSKKNEIIEGIRVKRLPYIAKIANTNITLTLALELIREDFDIMHTHLPDPWSASLSSSICAIKKKPLILTYHNDIVGKGIYGCIAKAYNFSLLPWVLGISKRIIITHKEYLTYSLYLKKYKEKIIVIPLGVNPDEFKVSIQKKRQEKTILFLGLLDEFHRYKGLDYLIRAMNLIKREIPNARLIIGGEGVLKNYYKELARSLGLDKQIEFIGFIPRERLSNFYSEGDVFVLPSLSCAQEGFGIVLLEAMAASKPVVTTDIVGTANKLRAVNAGRVVKPGDTQALAKAIVVILGDEELANSMGGNGQRLVQEYYDWRMIAREILELYRDAQRASEI